MIATEFTIVNMIGLVVGVFSAFRQQAVAPPCAEFYWIVKVFSTDIYPSFKKDPIEKYQLRIILWPLQEGWVLIISRKF